MSVFDGTSTPLPEGWWANPEVVGRLVDACFSKHTVAIGMAYLLDSEQRFEWFTGFILRLNSSIWWLTAGHVISRMVELKRNKAVKVVSSSLNDLHATPEASSIPFALEDERIYADPQVDFGAIQLREGYSAPLLANPDVVPVTPEIWAHVHESKPNGFYLLGYPECLASEPEEVERKGKRIYYTASTYLICNPITPIMADSTREPQQFWNRPESFYAEVQTIPDPTGDDLKSIKGMSGGPILSIEKNSRGFVYRLWGIQSSWLPRSRILRAEPISRIAVILEEWERQASNKATSQES